MKTLKNLCILSLLSFVCMGTSAFGSESISAFQAKNHIGSTFTVCGVLTEVVERKKQSFANFEGRYPNQIFHLWLTKSYNIQALKNAVGKEVCSKGRITEYKGRPQIKDPEEIIIKD